MEIEKVRICRIKRKVENVGHNFKKKNIKSFDNVKENKMIFKRKNKSDQVCILKIRGGNGSRRESGNWDCYEK